MFLKLLKKFEKSQCFSEYQVYFEGSPSIISIIVIFFFSISGHLLGRYLFLSKMYNYNIIIILIYSHVTIR